MEILKIISDIPFVFEVGDPNPLAWATVAAYLAAAVGCGLCAKDARRIFGGKQVRLHRLIWAFMSILMLVLGINKQLDVQTWFTAVVKASARHYDIYELGKHSQGAFIALLGGISLLGMGWGAWLIRKQWRRYIFLLIGGVFIVRFVLVRAAGFYGVHLPELSTLTGGIRLNWLMEIMGASVVALAAFLNRRWRKQD